jgi:pantoate--beta-alanine ligase
VTTAIRSRLPFEIVRDPAEIRARAEDVRRDGVRIGLVPTMGFLHAGHESLLRAARAQTDVVILTLFLNPTQFGPGEDLARYPRAETSDVAMAQRCGVDLVFCPAANAMYPPNHQTRVEVLELQKPMCGASRPGHFAGVATVVTKLFNLTRPHVGFFGEKDYQQLAIIRRLVRDLDLGVEIVGLPIVREPDGLAMSSRNVYLSGEERIAARSLSTTLAGAEASVRAGERTSAAVVAAARDRLMSEPRVRVDYVELRDADELTPIVTIERPAVLAIAAYDRATRLIDNRVLRP